RKGLVVNQEKLKVYRFMVERYLDGDSVADVAWQLNKMGVPSPRNGRWHDNVVHRILSDETHLGKIIANKTEGDICRRRPGSKPFRRMPKDEWIVVEGCHDAVKTEDEHTKILAIMRKKAITRSKPAMYPLSGL
ncbi:recombinase family protein, partial [Mycobacterium tuberculosis]|uniref:recombinase family protein n=1 Tax=Mycobacterium tuberculosis TaxID=1773 RepID=UPI00158779BF